MSERIVVGMSGGVDSSVTAALLREEGADVVGVFMRSGVSTAPAGAGVRAGKQGCCSADDARDARRVADAIGVPFYSINFEAEFGRIIDDFVDAYRAGRTPNPCVRCNGWLKFGHLVSVARKLGATAIATGHYARIVATAAGGSTVARAADRSKDQSYFLHTVSPATLAATRFPLGDLDKATVRDHARRLGLRVAEKPESQEICFTAGADYRDFVRPLAPEAFTPGELVHEDGRVLGRHDGIGAYTIGQRRGLGVTVGAPLYVVAIDAAANRVVVGDADALRRSRVVVDEMAWSGRPPPRPGESVRGRAQVRYRHQAAPATATPLPDGGLAVVFDEPVRAPAPGQSLVLYDAADEVLLGGGFIAPPDPVEIATAAAAEGDDPRARP